MAYKLGPVKPWVEAAANELGPMFGFTNIGGYRAFGSVPNSDHPKGLALDFMTLNKGKGDRLVAYVIANAKRLGVTYVIYWGRIWNISTGTWKTYTGPSPHIDHVHVSFSVSGPGGGVTTPVATVPVGIASSIPFLGDLEAASERLTDPKFWQRVGLYGLGAVLILYGILFLIRKPVESAASDIVKVVK